jgi:hypothetical protein
VGIISILATGLTLWGNGTGASGAAGMKAVVVWVWGGCVKESHPDGRCKRVEELWKIA